MNLEDLSPFDDEKSLRAVMETPRGYANKYDYDPACHCLGLAKVLPEGMVFPYDFGFIPGTLGEDGDPLDVLVLMDFAVPPLCIIQIRLIGVIEAKQKAKGEKWCRNDRLVAVAAHAKTHQTIASFADLRPHLLAELKSFFEQYNALEERKFKPIHDGNAERAMKLVKDGMKARQKNE